MVTSTALMIVCGLAVAAVPGAGAVRANHAEDAGAGPSGGQWSRPVVPNGSDTRVAASARRPLAARSGAPERGSGAASIKPGSWRNLLAHRAPGIHPATLRNAIGAPVVRYQDAGARDSFGRDGAKPATTDRVAPFGAKPEAFGPVPLPTVHVPRAGASPINRAVISGTNVARRVSVPAGIGGPARSSGGINGTVIRPKH